jgi:hypothetical protein
MAKLRNEPSYQRERFGLIACVPVHLSATGLPCRKIDRMAQPLKHLDDGLASLGKQGVVVAGNKQRDLQDRPPIAVQQLACSIESLFPDSIHCQLR